MKLELRELCKKYGDKIAVNNLSIQLEPGIYGILGQNGAGKSTIINMITDNLARTGGEILFNGVEIKNLGKEFRKKIGYMPQQQGFYENMSAEAFLYYMGEVKGISKKEIKKQVPALLEIVHLKDVASKKISSFSGGMKQRVLLAQALLGNPEILILDEPTVGLDPKERISIRNYIAELSGTKIILFATHIVSDIECIADKVIVMKSGEIVQFGSPIELISQIEDKMFEKKCEKEELKQLRNQYQCGNVIQKKEGIYFRIAGEKKPEGFEKAGNDINLEDVYLYYFG